MKKLLLLVLATTLLWSCDEKQSDNALSVSTELLEFDPSGGTQEFGIISNTSWKIIVSDDKANVKLSEWMGTGDATISVTLPLSSSISDVDTRLIVRTADGASLRNVVLRQKGHLVSGTTLYISNYANKVAMDGKALSEDSLTIISNVPWQLKGPEWIEAYYDNKWVKLSPDRAMVSGAATAVGQEEMSYNLKIRCATDNAEDEDRTGTIVLESTYDNAKYEDITISQLGRYRVDADQVITMAHSFGWTWKTGKDVAGIICYVGSPSYGEAGVFDFSEWMESAPGYVCGIDGLQSNTMYSIYAYGLDESGNVPSSAAKSWHATAYTTGSDVNQPLATISNLIYDGTNFNWTVTQNEQSYMFFQMIIDDANTMALNDGYISWIFDYNLHDSELTKKFPGYTYRQYPFQYKTDYHIQIVTWAIAQGGTRPSYLLTRYSTEEHWNAQAAGKAPENKPHFVSRPLNTEKIKKSVVLIK